jgi:hypothetical protein
MTVTPAGSPVADGSWRLPDARGAWNPAHARIRMADRHTVPRLEVAKPR